MDDKDLRNDFLSIKEFSEIVGMTTETLRYYDKKDLFKPTMLGEGTLNKYRYYAPTQITTVKIIRVLSEIGVPLDTVKDLMKNRTPESLIKLFSKQKNIVADELNYLNEVHSVISIFLELLMDGIRATENEICVHEMPELPIILGSANNFCGSTSFYSEFIRFLKAPHNPELNLSYPVGGYWGSMEAFISESSQPAQFFSLDPKGFDKKNKGLYLTGYTRGQYGQTNDLPDRMANFAKNNGLIFTGPVYNIYLFDEISINEPERYLLQASALVKETQRVASRRPIRRL